MQEMQNMPLVSVLMCIYKEPIEWLKKSIDSIVNQTYSNLQIVIVIDNPDNKEAEDLVKSYLTQCKNITYIVNEANYGLVKSLNIGLKLCNGEYIARMDADDISDENRIEKQLVFLIDNKLDLIGCRYTRFSDNFEEETETVYSSKACELILRYCPCMAHPTWLGQRSVFDVLEGYREIDACEDYDFAIRALNNHFKLGNMPMNLFKYRDNQQSISHLKSGRQAVLTDYISNQWRRKLVPTGKEIKQYQDSDIFINQLTKYEQYQLFPTESKKSFVSFMKNKLFNYFFIKQTKKKIYIKMVKLIDSVLKKQMIYYIE